METTQTAPRKTLYSAIQPSGSITLGNYIGALRNFVLLAEDYDCLFCMADLHALTVRQEPAALRRNTQSLAALYIACGIDPEKSIVYCQSHVPEHAELAWILNCFTYMGELSRMTQFKDKSAKHADNINAGLFAYPSLMAADILLYQTNLVPVGADQKQHLELARDIANRLNGLYPGLFTVPEPYISKTSARIMSLSDPTRKMSKSDAEDSYIAVLDTPDVIRRKFRRAVTDSETEIRYDPENKPGVSNLLSIIAALDGITPEEEAVKMQGLQYGALKEAASESVIAVLAPIQERYQQLMGDKEYIQNTLKAGAERAHYLALKTLRKVYKKLGLYQL
ncbi:MAG: tryptophan--tRNA ligase [Clostridia bacterium]|nr:tryptophan--tRNA ligase [Clostridia bacterium]